MPYNGMFETSFKSFLYSTNPERYMKKLFKFSIIFLIGFILNAIWELSHYQLYYDLSGISKYPHLLLATITDAVIILLIFMVILFIHRNRNMKWVSKPRWLDHLIIILIGMGIAIFIELRALRIERWAYKASMPTIFGIGLSPLLQLAITGILTLLIIRKIFKL